MLKKKKKKSIVLIPLPSLKETKSTTKNRLFVLSFVHVNSAKRAIEDRQEAFFGRWTRGMEVEEEEEGGKREEGRRRRRKREGGGRKGGREEKGKEGGGGGDGGGRLKDWRFTEWRCVF